LEDRFILTPYSLDEVRPELRELAGPGWHLNLTTLPEASQQLRMAAVQAALARRVADALRSGERPVSVAGDCCSALGVVAGMQQAGIDPVLIWLDAHGDFNTWETTPSGYIGGMPLAMLVGRGEQTMPHAVGLRRLDETDVVLTDARDLDPGERSALERSQINRLPSMADLIPRVLPDRPLLVHFDVDIIDPAEAAAVSFPAVGGPSVEELRRVFRRLAADGRIQAVSMATWEPDLDPEGTTAHVCMDLLQSLLAE
jgi:arginase